MTGNRRKDKIPKKIVETNSRKKFQTDLKMNFQNIFFTKKYIFFLNRQFFFKKLSLVGNNYFCDIQTYRQTANLLGLFHILKPYTFKSEFCTVVYCLVLLLFNGCWWTEAFQSFGGMSTFWLDYCRTHPALEINTTIILGHWELRCSLASPLSILHCLAQLL